jgi:hypothetical protein
LSESHTVSNDFVDDLLWGLGTVEFGLLFALLLGNNDLTERFQLFVFLELEVLGAADEVAEVEVKFDHKSI